MHSRSFAALQHVQQDVPSSFMNCKLNFNGIIAGHFLAAVQDSRMKAGFLNSSSNTQAVKPTKAAVTTNEDKASTTGAARSPEVRSSVSAVSC
jgi:hypothetical protein